jgi:MFS family permease
MPPKRKAHPKNPVPDSPPRKLQSYVPHRLDRLPWSRWHWLVITGLGITWVLDGLEVTLAGAVGGVLKQSLHMSDAQVGASATFYLMGAVLGALGFGYATDRLGRKKLFTITLLVYLLATACSALAWNFWSFAFFRFVTGTGIGGEYAAINSAIDELIPARVRGHVDLLINATYWLGAAFGAAATILLLDAHLISPTIGWRFAFLLGASLGVVIIFIRHFVPESPRWLMTHGREQEAEEIVSQIEAQVRETQHLPEPEGDPLTITVRSRTPWKEIWNAMVHVHGKRSLLGLSLMISQAFFYNAIFFTYALLLVEFYRVAPERVGFYLLPFSISNLLGPVLMGRLFDTLGRKLMITVTYALSGILLAISGWLFQQGALTGVTQTICWTVIFFIASCAASSAYLTVSEVFPLEIRAMAISIFYAIGTLIGGVGAPALFGALIGSGSRTYIFYGYIFGAVLMLIGAGTEWQWGVNAERQSLESIAAPLTSSR